ncbi:hypothetical protein ACFY05_14350 [Microtetraspora fusca]|uniref:Uncharacterized protein n=1 Tax=Microtetraspora fusca TaxID=1997 RepID=A0ABW6V3Z9_MICFU
MAAAARAGRHERVRAGRVPSRRGADPAQRLRLLDPGLLSLVKVLRLIRLLRLRGLYRLVAYRLGVGGVAGGDELVGAVDQPPGTRRCELRVLRLVGLCWRGGLVAYRLRRLGAAGGDELVRAVDQPPRARSRGLVGVRATAGAALRRRLVGYRGGEGGKLPRRRSPGGIACRIFSGGRDRRGRRRVFLIA